MLEEAAVKLSDQFQAIRYWETAPFIIETVN